MSTHDQIKRLARLLLEDPGDEGAREHMAHVLERGGVALEPFERSFRCRLEEGEGQIVWVRTRPSYVLETLSPGPVTTLEPITHARMRELNVKEVSARLTPPPITVTNYGFAVPEDVARRVGEIVDSELRRQPPQPPGLVQRAFRRMAEAARDFNFTLPEDDDE